MVKIFGFLCPNFSALVWKDYPFSMELLLHICQPSVGHLYVGHLLSSLFCSFDLCQSCRQYYRGLDYCSFVLNLKVVWFLKLYSFSKLFYSSSLAFP